MNTFAGDSDSSLTDLEELEAQAQKAATKSTLDSDQENAMPDPQWPEVSTAPDSTSTRNPPLPPSKQTSLIDDSEISIITPEAFLENISHKRKELVRLSSDKTIPLTARYHVQKALEVMDQSRDSKFIFSVAKGEKLPDKEEVKVVHQNLLKKRNNSTSAASNKQSKKIRHKFTSSGLDESPPINNKKMLITNQETTPLNLEKNPTKTKDGTSINHQSTPAENLEDRPDTNPANDEDLQNHQTNFNDENSVNNHNLVTDNRNPAQDLNPGKNSESADNPDPTSNHNPENNQNSTNNEKAQSKSLTSKANNTNPAENENPNQPTITTDSQLESTASQSNALTSVPIIKKHREILGAIHQLFSTSPIYEGYKTALDSVSELYNYRMQQTMLPTSYSNTLSSRIQFNRVSSTSVKAWVKNLRREGPDVLSPSSNEPFFRPDVWKFPTNIAKEPAETEIGAELFSLFKILCYPTERIQHKWAAIFFQAVSLVAKDINSLPVYEKPTDPNDELGTDISMIKYFISCLSSSSNPNQIAESTSNKSKSKEEKNCFSSLDNPLNAIPPSFNNFHPNTYPDLTMLYSLHSVLPVCGKGQLA
ncbi:hypothetical protein PGT21_030594 [Puccinia graminis f. sp. tritici]|uniref:Uncharacterized protein n=1 Tax=Puccinia graminis f. sp. tritici TaxID=56615 RepID=A0A5B0N5P8_PUCGR|nr:hypothetical protein PGT21_030594 [Puccinia graminis f. sp. tritici]